MGPKMIIRTNLQSPDIFIQETLEELRALEAERHRGMGHDVLQAGVALFERHLCLCVPAVGAGLRSALAAGLLPEAANALCGS